MKKTIVVILILSLILPNTVFAADALYRLMHNDQDALVIAEVTMINKDDIGFKVIKQIISPDDLDINNKKEQIELDEFLLKKSELKNVMLFKNMDNIDEFYKLNDSYLISLDQSIVGLKIAWGMYKLSSSDYKTLDILYEDGTSGGLIMDAMAIKHFINSDGVMNNFSFSENALYYDKKIIYRVGDEDNTKAPEKDIIDKEEQDTVDKEFNNNLKNKSSYIIILVLLPLIIIFIRMKNRKK